MVQTDVTIPGALPPAPATPAVAAPETPEQLNARILSLEREKAKLENDLKATRGRSSKQVGLENRLARIESGLSGFQEMLSAISAGDTEKFTQVQTNYVQTQQERQFQAEANEIFEEVMDSLNDEEGNQVLDLRTAPELEEWRQGWNTALAQHDTRALARLQAKAERLARQAEKQHSRGEAKKVEEAARTTVREKLQAADVYDTDSAPRGGSGCRRQFTRDDLAKMTPEEYAKYRDHILRS